MKKIFYLLACLSLFLLPGKCLAENIFGVVMSFPHEMEDGHWNVKGGKLELSKGSWRFGAKDIKRDSVTGKVTAVYYTCFCKYTIINNSDRAYEIDALIYSYPKTDSKSRSAPIATKIEHKEPIVLKAGESRSFNDEFRVKREIALETKDVEIGLSYREPGSK